MARSDHPLVLVGRVTSVFGIKGWVNVYSYTDPPENILSYKPWLLNSVEGDGQKKRKNLPDRAECTLVEVTDGQRSGKKIIAELNHCQTREAAMQFVRQDIFIPRDELPELDEEVYWVDLEGLEVINQDSMVLGRIESMISTGANDVMLVLDENGQEILIPYVEEHYVKEVNIEQGWIKVDWELE